MADPQLFAYDKARPLAVKVAHETSASGVVIQDISFDGIDRPDVSAYLIEPSKELKPVAAVLFVHWYAPGGNRDEFLEEAKALARQGLASLLVQGFFPWSTAPSGVPQDRTAVIAQTIELRRAIDVLSARKEIDGNRIGFVGHDFGAMYGAVLQAIDPRIRATVLMAGVPRFSDWFIPYWSVLTPGSGKTYLNTMGPVEPIGFLALKHGGPILFQFGQRDRFVSEQDAQLEFGAAVEPKEVRRYDTEHDLGPDALTERDTWILGHL